jgi:hypothetical protein
LHAQKIASARKAIARPGLDVRGTANEQGVEPAEHFDALLGDIWSGDEFAEGIIDRARKPERLLTLLDPSRRQDQAQAVA